MRKPSIALAAVAIASLPSNSTIECTTSANSTVTCLYSAGVVAVATAAPHSLQNFEFGDSSVPQDPHANPVAVMSWP